MRVPDRFARFKKRGTPLMTLILTLSFATLVVGCAGIVLWQSDHRWVGGLLVAIAAIIGVLNRDIADPYWHSEEPKQPKP